MSLPEPHTTLKEVYRQYLSDCIGKQCAGTKKHVDTHRAAFANNRHSCGFSDTMKQLTFALCTNRCEDAYIYDVDGNQYLDITMGFGVHLFGHSPAFVTNAIQQQLHNGYSLGPVHVLAAQVASLICKMTANERAAFFNSGTEAVMVALRLARAATGKKKIVIFEGAYHGTHDSLLVMKTHPNTHEAIANVPGITQSLVQDTILLEFGSEKSLRVIEEQSGEIAAVITEPVRSRHTETVNPAFLQNIQQLCREKNIAFILDEIITGFRLLNGGAKQLFALDPDIITYGKVLGGGLPIGVVAGKKKYMDYIDGGDWNFNDDSQPSSPATFVAGTFCHHPLTMAASLAVLQQLDSGQNRLQQALTLTTGSLCECINKFCAERAIPVSIVHFGSMFRFMAKARHKILYHALLKEKVYLWEGKTCFLSTAHGEKEIKLLEERIKKCLIEMKAAGYFPQTVPALPGDDIRNNWYIKGGFTATSLLHNQWLQLSFNYLCECLITSNACTYTYSMTFTENSVSYSPEDNTFTDIHMTVINGDDTTSCILECRKNIADGWSLSIFLHFLSACYQAFENAQPLPANPFRTKNEFCQWVGAGKRSLKDQPVYNAYSISRLIDMPHEFMDRRSNHFEWLLAAFAISLGEGSYEIGVPVSGQLRSRLVNTFGNCTCQVPVKITIISCTRPADLVDTIAHQVRERKKEFRYWYSNGPAKPFDIVFNLDNLKDAGGFAGRPIRPLDIMDDFTRHSICCNVLLEKQGYHLSIKYKEGSARALAIKIAGTFAALIQEKEHVPS